MASVTQQTLLAQGGNAVAARPGWHWPLSVVPDTPIWRDHSLFSDNSWLAAIQYAASLVPKSVTWQPPLSAPSYLQSHRLSPSITDASSYAGNWLSSAGIVPAATPAFIGWQQELSVSRVTKQPLWADASSYQASAWLEAATYVSPAIAFLARTSGLDATHTNAYTALINGLAADGVWSKLDLLHIYATQDSTTALLNLVSTSYNGTANGTPSFSVDLGYTGIESSSTVYINTGFNPTSGSPNYTQNSAHISEWPLTNFESSSAGVGSIGASSNNSTFMLARYITGDAYFLINNAQFGGYNLAVADSLGHYVASRTASNLYGGYKNGTSIIAPILGSTTLVNQNFYGLAINNNGAALGAGRQVAAISVGGGLTAGEVTSFYNRLRTYMTTVGVP